MEQNPWHDSGEVSDAWAQSSERPLAKHLPGRLQNDVPHRFQLILRPPPRRQDHLHVPNSSASLEGGCAKTPALVAPTGPPPSDANRLRRVSPIRNGQLPTQPRPIPCFFSSMELTYADKWFLWLKNFYDQGWPLRIAATSSSTAALRDRRLESGVGRWEEQYLAPYLFPEFLELIEPRAGPPYRPWKRSYAPA